MAIPGISTPDRTTISFAPKTHAQSISDADNSGALTEIVVTAQKRTSTVQETPISITAKAMNQGLTAGFGPSNEVDDTVSVAIRHQQKLIRVERLRGLHLAPP